MEHIAIMDKKTIDKILSGEKLIESRFSKNKITPFHNINIGDTVYLKKSGGSILASFEVKDVVFFEDLNSAKINEIKGKYNIYINAPDEFWKLKIDSKYGTLIYIKEPKKIKPISIIKKNRSAFVTLKENHLFKEE